MLQYTFFNITIIRCILSVRSSPDLPLYPVAPSNPAGAAVEAGNPLDTRIGQVGDQRFQNASTSSRSLNLARVRIADLEGRMGQAMSELPFLKPINLSTHIQQEAKRISQLAPEASVKEAELLIKDFRSLLKSCEKCYHSICETDLNTLNDLYRLISALQILKAPSDSAFIKECLTAIKETLKHLLHSHIQQSQKKLEEDAALRTQKAIKIRQKCADYLIGEEDPKGQAPFVPDDLKKWELLYKNRKMVLEISKFDKTLNLGHLLFRLSMPIAEEDLSTLPCSIPTYEKIQLVAHRTLTLTPEQQSCLLPVDPEWVITQFLGQGHSKKVYKIINLAKRICRALAISLFPNSESGLQALFKAKQEADLLSRLQDTKGCVQFYSVSYTPLVRKEIEAVQQGLLLHPYQGNGHALLTFLKSAEGSRFNTLKHLLHIWKNLVNGLHILHYDHNRIHQDLKLGNILFKIDATGDATSPEWEIDAVISDFGSATTPGQTQRGFTMVCCPPEILKLEANYLKSILDGKTPPSTLTSEAINPKFDVYMLGLIGYLLFFGYNEAHLGTTQHYQKNGLYNAADYKERIRLIEEDFLPSFQIEILSAFKDQPDTIEHLIWRMCHPNAAMRPTLPEIMEFIIAAEQSL